MARQSFDPGTGSRPARYTETRPPSFVGGEIDPETGNIVQPSKSGTLAGSTATSSGAPIFPLQKTDKGTAESPAPPSDPYTPRTPTTRLADIDKSIPTFDAPRPVQQLPPQKSGSDLTGQALSVVASGLSSFMRDRGSKTREESSSSKPTVATQGGNDAFTPTTRLGELDAVQAGKPDGAQSTPPQATPPSTPAEATPPSTPQPPQYDWGSYNPNSSMYKPKLSSSGEFQGWERNYDRMPLNTFDENGVMTVYGFVPWTQVTPQMKAGILRGEAPQFRPYYWPGEPTSPTQVQNPVVYGGGGGGAPPPSGVPINDDFLGHGQTPNYDPPAFGGPQYDPAYYGGYGGGGSIYINPGPTSAGWD